MTSPIVVAAVSRTPIKIEYLRNAGSISLQLGQRGLPLNLTIGTVATGAPGSSADATIGGTSPDLHLDLTLPRGATGAPNTLTIGTVTTGAPGSDAAAAVGGTAPDQHIDLTLPRGATGPANSLAIGTVTTLLPGQSPTADISGSAPNQTLNLGLPPGQTGGTGPQGSQGPAGTSLALTIGAVTTGAPGSAVAASLTGTAPNYVLNLTIPQGAVGATGSAANMGVYTMLQANSITPVFGAFIYISDGHKAGDTVGAGTGCPVYGFNSTDWLRFNDDGKAIPDLPTLPGGQSFLTDADGTYLVEAGNYLTE